MPHDLPVASPYQVANSKSQILKSRNPKFRRPPSPPSTPRKPRSTKRPGPSTSACRSRSTNSIGMKLVLIPPGEFMMGSPKELIEEELKSTW